MATSMIKGCPLRSMLQFALPLLIGNLLLQTYNIVDAAIVSLCFVRSFGYNAICFTDQTAWVTACCYIAPTCFYCVKKVTKMLRKGESETV